jgi:phospholipase A1
MRKLLLAGLLALTLAAPGQARAYSNETSEASIRLQGYRPSFLLLGRPEQKLQLSLKAQVIQGAGLYVAYTQLMFWELFLKDSSPFKDINFNPEAFYRFRLGSPENKEEVRWIDVGYEHESNGRDGEFSRSWDRLFVLFSAESLIGKKDTRLQWSLKAWVPIDRDHTNRDILRYRGLWEANATLIDLFGPFFDRNDLTLRIYGGGRSGLDPLKGGQELTFRFNKWPDRKALPMLVIQAFNGYGEGLAFYNQKRFGIRGGFGF